MQSNQFDVVVAGAGLAGLTAAAAAAEAEQNLRVALVATGPGSFVLGPGWLKSQDFKQAGANGFKHAGANADLDAAIAFFRRIARLAGCPFAGAITGVRYLPTVLGEFQSVALAPFTLWNGEPRDDTPTAIVGIHGLSSFDENFMAERLNDSARRLGFKGTYVARQITLARDFGMPVMPTRIAKCFDRDADFRAELIRALRPVASEFERVLVPGILGLESDEGLLAQFEAELGCSVAELPTLPPSIPGLRIFRRLEGYLRKIGVEFYHGFPVGKLEVDDGYCTGLLVESPGRPLILHSRSVVLATGQQAAHLLVGAGAELDEQMRPLHAKSSDAKDSAGKSSPIARNLFVAGSSQLDRHYECRREANRGEVAAILAGYRAGKLVAGMLSAIPEVHYATR